MRAPITFALTACASLAVWVGSPPAEAVPTTAASGAEAIEEVGTVEVRDERDPAWWWGTDYPQIDRVVALPLAQVMRRNALLLVVDHRTNQEIADNSWHDFLGLDAGALKIGLELRFGVYDNLDLGLLRLNSASERFDVYQLDAKYHLLHQHRHHVDVALRAGLTWFSQQDADDALGGLAQLLIQRRLVDRLTLVTGLLYHSCLLYTSRCV